MTASTLDLTDFLLARIAEDEERSRVAPTSLVGVNGAIATYKRTLADGDAKRQIVRHCEGIINDWPCRYLALPYADHPDYREEWRP